MKKFDSPLHGAIYLFNRGFKLFPLRDNSKIPLRRGWWEWAATATIGHIETHALAHPDCNWGMIPHLSGHAAIDVDHKKGPHVADSLRGVMALHGIDLNTMHVRTATGGVHYIHTGACLSSVERLAPGIDTRGIGGYIVAAGAIYGSKSYDLFEENEYDITQLPPSITDELARPLPDKGPAALATAGMDSAQNVYAATEYLRDQAPTATEGKGGDACLLKVVMGVRDFGISESKCEELILEIWNPYCKPPWNPNNPEDYEHMQQKIKNGYTYAQNSAIGVKAPDAILRTAQADFEKEPLPAAPPPVVAPKPKGTPYAPRDAKDIDWDGIGDEDWILPGHYAKEYASCLIAPGGTGKSNFEMLRAMCVATGRHLLGPKFVPKLTGPVLLYNGEDTLRMMERRLLAMRLHYGIPAEELWGKFFLLSGADLKFKILSVENGKIKINRDNLMGMTEALLERRCILVSFDPLRSTHYAAENNTEQMAEVMERLIQIGRDVQCAISVPHHASKLALNPTSAYDTDSQSLARGASAIVDAARIVNILTTMRDADALKNGLDKSRAKSYFRCQTSKINIRNHSDEAWYQLCSQRMPYQGETVVVSEWADLKAAKEVTELAAKESTQSEVWKLLHKYLPEKISMTVSDFHKLCYETYGHSLPVDSCPSRFRKDFLIPLLNQDKNGFFRIHPTKRPYTLVMGDG